MVGILELVVGAPLDPEPSAWTLSRTRHLTPEAVLLPWLLVLSAAATAMLSILSDGV